MFPCDCVVIESGLVTGNRKSHTTAIPHIKFFPYYLIKIAKSTIRPWYRAMN